MCKEHIKDLFLLATSFLFYKEKDTDRQLDQRLVRCSANTRQGQHEIVLHRAIEKPSPDASSQNAHQTQDVHDLAAEFHSRRDPDDIEKPQEEIVQCRPAIHILQRHACLVRYRRPGCTPVILAKGHDAGIRRDQEERPVLFARGPVLS